MVFALPSTQRRAVPRCAIWTPEVTRKAPTTPLRIGQDNRQTGNEIASCAIYRRADKRAPTASSPRDLIFHASVWS